VIRAQRNKPACALAQRATFPAIRCARRLLPRGHVAKWHVDVDYFVSSLFHARRRNNFFPTWLRVFSNVPIHKVVMCDVLEENPWPFPKSVSVFCILPARQSAIFRASFAVMI